MDELIILVVVQLVIARDQEYRSLVPHDLQNLEPLRQRPSIIVGHDHFVSYKI